MEDLLNWKSKFESCTYSDRLLYKLALINEKAIEKIDILEVKKAIYYAKKYHGDQKRQSGEPYYSHPLEVAYMLAECSREDRKKYFRTDLIVTSILHDTIEDTSLTFEIIKNIFGEVVASQVMDLTRIKADGQKISAADIVNSLWTQKKFELLFIKQLDRLHNLQTIQAKSQDKVQKIIDETFNTFVVSAIGTEDKHLEKAIYTLCCKTLSIEMIHYEFQQNQSHLFFEEDTDIHRSLSQVFQNVITQPKNPK